MRGAQHLLLQNLLWLSSVVGLAVQHRSPSKIGEHDLPALTDTESEISTPDWMPLRRDEDTQDPNDQSWITSWAAIGDSYSAGIGCGFRLDSACSRYNFSWPNLMNNDYRMGGGTRDFQFLACSGATSPEILANQVSQIQNGVQAITLTAGGNDAGFSEVLKSCIFPIATDQQVACNTALTKANYILRSDDFRGSISSLISGAVSKLGTDGRLYYVGYAPFFNAESTQCNDVSWSVRNIKGATNKAKLSTDLRHQINVLVSEINAILDGLAQAAGEQVVFVDYSGWVSRVEGRFCEEGVQEPFGNNPDLFFYEWGTFDEWQESVDLGISDRSAEQYPSLDSNTTFGGQVQADLTRARVDDPNLELRDIFSEDSSDTKITLPDNPQKRDTFLMDSISRVFHPTLVGHSLIANLVFYHMGAQRAQMLEQTVTPLVAEFLPSSCSIEDDRPGQISAQRVDCSTASQIASDAWFDLDTAKTAKENFCSFVSRNDQVNIADVTDQDSTSVGTSYPYLASQPIDTWIEMWVQNAGCNRPTLYPDEKVCHAMIDAIVNQCGSIGSTKRYGGSAAYSCQEYHMTINQRFTKFKEVVNNWNSTSGGTPAGPHFPIANITLIRTESTATSI